MSLAASRRHFPDDLSSRHSCSAEQEIPKTPRLCSRFSGERSHLAQHANASNYEAGTLVITTGIHTHTYTHIYTYSYVKSLF